MGSDPLRKIVITEVGYTLTSKNNTTLVSDAAPLSKIYPSLTSTENIQILKHPSPELKKISIIIWQQEIRHPLCTILLLEGMNIRPASSTHVCRKAVTKSAPRGEVVVFPKYPVAHFDISVKNFIKN